jgi:CHAP domain
MRNLQHRLRNLLILGVTVAILAAVLVLGGPHLAFAKFRSVTRDAVKDALHQVKEPTVDRPEAIPASGLTMPILRQRIVAYAESQLGYKTDPSNGYCNKFSAYWQSGSDECGSGLLSEEWCADFAAWAWQEAGADVVYQFINGDLNSSAASFYEWGVNEGTWHPVGSGYIPQPGDVAVYGLDAVNLVAQHVAVVTGYTPGDKGPNVINGDGNHKAFSDVESEDNEFVADGSGTASGAPLSGYVTPTLPS